jgi:polyhydroxybutyrate depolymerase
MKTDPMRATYLLSTTLFVALCATGCGSSSTAAPAGSDGGGDGGAGMDGANADSASSSEAHLDLDGTIGGDRPVVVHVPPGYVTGVAAPLVIMLHGYGATAAIEEGYLKFRAQSDARGFLYATPEGLIDASGNHYWNATDACCDINSTMVDDSTYLSNVIKQIKAQYTVDPKKVFFIGHSNGAFMSYRMACDHADQIAAVASLAGAMPSNVAACAPTQAVSVVEIHGTSDTTVVYSYPGATTTVSDWVTLDGCAATADTSAPAIDLESTIPGNETTVTKYAAGCRAGGHAELWAINGGAHIPALSPTFTTQVIDFLYAHPKP